MDFVLARAVRTEPGPANGVPSGGPGQPKKPLSTLSPFEVLYEADLPTYELPDDLEDIYGRLGFPDRVFYSNFVSSIDGAVSLGSTPSAGSVISARYPADRFLMGLLRACADAVVIGAGTLRGTPGHHWTPQHVYPDLADSFARLRRKLGRPAEVRLVVLTNGSSPLDPAHLAIVGGATIVTTPLNARTLRPQLPDSCDFIELAGDAGVDLKLAVDELRSRGYGVLLTEGGPHLLGELIKQRLLDEIFLTISPLVAGRNSEERLGMVAGVEILPAHNAASTLLSARRHGDYLFLRYASATRSDGLSS